jgi:L-galactose dehydrogenase
VDTTTLGRTGLTVSVAGLGCGGDSRIGMATGLDRAGTVRLIREAHDLGVTLFDTGRVYGTEEILGEAIAAMPRDRIVVATKYYGKADMTGADVVAALETSLRALGTDYVDIFQIHALHPDEYDHAEAALVPALQRARAAGKFRFLGVTETGPRDPGQKMLQRAVRDDVWDVMMLAFHIMHQGARTRLFPYTRAKGIGTMIMFAVRYLFSAPGLLQKTVAGLAADGKLPPALAADPEPLGFLIHEGGARDVIDACYRFARHEPGAEVVLFGTGNPAHLQSNLASLNRPPLPAADLARLAGLFGHLEGVGLDLSARSRNGPAGR